MDTLNIKSLMISFEKQSIVWHINTTCIVTTNWS